MYDVNMFKTGIRGFEKDEVLAYLQKQDEEYNEKLKKLEEDLAKKDEVIADLRERLTQKDEQHARLESELRSKYQEYVDNYQQIGELSLRVPHQGRQDRSPTRRSAPTR